MNHSLTNRENTICHLSSLQTYSGAASLSGRPELARSTELFQVCCLQSQSDRRQDVSETREASLQLSLCHEAGQLRPQLQQWHHRLNYPGGVENTTHAFYWRYQELK